MESVAPDGGVGVAVGVGVDGACVGPDVAPPVGGVGLACGIVGVTTALEPVRDRYPLHRRRRIQRRNLRRRL